MRSASAGTSDVVSFGKRRLSKNGIRILTNSTGDNGSGRVTHQETEDDVASSSETDTVGTQTRTRRSTKSEKSKEGFVERRTRWRARKHLRVEWCCVRQRRTRWHRWVQIGSKLRNLGIRLKIEIGQFSRRRRRRERVLFRVIRTAEGGLSTQAECRG